MVCHLLKFLIYFLIIFIIIKNNLIYRVVVIHLCFVSFIKTRNFQYKFFSSDILKLCMLNYVSIVFFWGGGFLPIRLATQFVGRINSEMFFCFLRVLKESSSFSLSFGNLRIWTYIFQLESLRFFQYNKLVLSKERINIFSNDVCENFFLKHVSDYTSYLFNTYIFKLNFILKEITLSSKITKYNTTLPIDLTIQNFLEEFRKGIYLIYNDFILNFQKFSSKNESLRNIFVNFGNLESKNIYVMRQKNYPMFE